MVQHLLSLVVPQKHVKLVKTALEQQGKLNRAAKIRSISDDNASLGSGGRCSIPTTISTGEYTHFKENSSTALEDILGDILRDLDIGTAIRNISVTISDAETQEEHPINRNPLIAGIETWLSGLPPDLLSSLALTPSPLLSSFPGTYSVYPPLLLFPAHAFASPHWQTLLAALQTHPSQLNHLYASLAASVNTTHIALNAPIPPQNQGQLTSNILRSPVSLTPLYNSFGPAPTPSTQTVPSPADFEDAFWCSARQNGIAQTWAPLYTMFSRGNVSEKARVLRLPSVRSAVEDGSCGEGGTGRGCTAVDMYTGIGYFAFSYRKAGMARVLCWELNPWSVEGLVRGCGINRWSVERMVLAPDEEGEERGEVPEAEFLVFQESNEHAGGRIRRLRDRLPPIRHVNCGLLPTSRGSWRTAVVAVDPSFGGWVHLHENMAVGEIGKKAEQVTREIEQISRDEGRGDVKLEHMEKVKTYAPGVMHCVLDIWIGPRQD
ncbi:hypothetical protein BU16DRAFT_64929 [Lophium mytilinum]|uniref:tRNA(Phe) (4-demethylwyosine(37)-C(7)) aminocarboxypropyltransferase n=1 Tax=Lophium mytilinum TaxID=390894 RepID=A0A6A6QNM4_9PEZI|nr:hypothetical protein BU16DRAFT_64929 [Lophium mytilinum]